MPVTGAVAKCSPPLLPLPPLPRPLPWLLVPGYPPSPRLRLPRVPSRPPCRYRVGSGGADTGPAVSSSVGVTGKQPRPRSAWRADDFSTFSSVALNF